MEFVKVLLIASQLAFVTCLPQGIRLVQPARLSLGQMPTERLPLAISNLDHEPFGFHFFINDRNRDQVGQSSLTLGTGANSGNPGVVQFFQQAGHDQGIIVLNRPTDQRAEIVFEGFLPHRPQHLASFDHENEVIDQQQGAISPSEAAGQEHFSSDVDPHGGTIQLIPPVSHLGTQIHPTATTPPITKPAPPKQDHKRPESVFVTRLTAPSSDPRSPNTLVVTKKPCEICCVGNEVEPCKSCCAHTPLLNPQTLKTVVG